MWKGTVVQESLEDENLFQFCKIASKKKGATWTLISIEVSDDQLENFLEAAKTSIKAGKWYTHIFQGDDGVAIYKNKIFKFRYDDKSTWEDMVNYGKSLDIPEEQLDFLREE